MLGNRLAERSLDVYQETLKWDRLLSDDRGFMELGVNEPFCKYLYRIDTNVSPKVSGERCRIAGHLPVI